MEKRGQLTLFVILGIAIVMVVGLLLYTRTNLFMFTPTEENLNLVMEDITLHVQDCIDDYTDGPNNDPLIDIAEQGGYLGSMEGNYRLYQGVPINYLCFNIPNDERCMNRMLLESQIEETLASSIRFGLQQCLDVQGFRKLGRFTVTTGELDVDVGLGKDSVAVNVHYPVTLVFENTRVSSENFIKMFDYPLGDLYKVSQDIIDYETEFGEFDQLIYMLAHKGNYKLEKKRPYPDKLYIISRKDRPEYRFQFFVEGE